MTLKRESIRPFQRPPGPEKSSYMHPRHNVTCHQALNIFCFEHWVLRWTIQILYCPSQHPDIKIRTLLYCGKKSRTKSKIVYCTIYFSIFLQFSSNISSFLICKKIVKRSPFHIAKGATLSYRTPLIVNMKDKTFFLLQTLPSLLTITTFLPKKAEVRQ